MQAKALSSADELNIDSYFREQSGSKNTVATESEEDTPDTSQQAPDEKPDKSSKKQADEDLDDDIDLEDEDDSDEGDEDSDEEDDLEDEDDSDKDEGLSAKGKKKGDSKEIEALKKQAVHAELNRAQMQSERDSYKAQFEKANSNIETLTEKVEQLTKLTQKLTKKTEQSDSSDVFTGDDDALVTEGTIKKWLEKQAKSSRKSDFEDDDDRPMSAKEIKELLKQQVKSETQDQQQPKIGSDFEAEKIWAEGQPDVVEVTSYYVDNKAKLDPELATIPTYAARYQEIRRKRMELELKATKKALRKAKQKIARMGKGELPETASGNRGKPSKINDKPSGDPLVDFFEK